MDSTHRRLHVRLPHGTGWAPQPSASVRHHMVDPPEHLEPRSVEELLYWTLASENFVEDFAVEPRLGQYQYQYMLLTSNRKAGVWAFHYHIVWHMAARLLMQITSQAFGVVQP
jgi:hypothetical protein